MKRFTRILSIALCIAPWVLVIIMCLMIVGLITMYLHQPAFDYVETSYPFGKPTL